jgi:hydrogenase expression/formation protein HypE
MNGIRCPLPAGAAQTILLGHGSGGRMSAELLREVFLPAFGNAVLERLDDSAELQAGGARIAFTTDAFVVSPLRFPGGDIGSIAVNGTINDLAMVGAEPLGLAAAFILEEGFPLPELQAIVASMRAAAAAARVPVVAGDTKVVERGKADGLFITTSGIGVVPGAVRLGPEQVQAGDAVLVSGPIGDHGIAVLSAREGLAFETTVESDSAPLHDLVRALLGSGAAVRCLRDPTRGGVATVLNEIAAGAGASVQIEEDALPVREGVRSACEILGLDPLYVACEGRFVALVGERDAERALAALRALPDGRDACRIGRVVARGRAEVHLRTAFGTTRVLDLLAGAQLPRIC